MEELFKLTVLLRDRADCLINRDSERVEARAKETARLAEAATR
jgi:hypothetical protein